MGYVADHRVSGVLHLATQMGRPLLMEGPAGTGKTELATSWARLTGQRLIRLQCYEGLDEAKVLYEWNYRKQLLHIQAQAAEAHSDPEHLEGDIFSEAFLLRRPVLEAISSPTPVVLLIDEIDRVDVETEALLLEVLSDFQVSIPELGTVTGTSAPTVFLTSNNTRDLSEALKRRCLYLSMDYPDLERETQIIMSRIPELETHLAGELAALVRGFRAMSLKKPPSVAETIDWATALRIRGANGAEPAELIATLPTLLKNRRDIEAVESRISQGPVI